jgi:hypothetical protein
MIEERACPIRLAPVASIAAPGVPAHAKRPSSPAHESA